MTKANKIYSLDDSLGNLSTLFSRAILKRINLELKRHGYKITSEQWVILVYVWGHNEQSQQALAEKLFKDKTTIARLVASVELLGLVVREAGQSDNREKIVFLTERGKQVMNRVTALVQTLLNEAGRGISEEEMKICKDVLRRAHKNIS
jgi:DNA-binding MarR family transcriptional regulator